MRISNDTSVAIDHGRIWEVGGSEAPSSGVVSHGREKEEAFLIEMSERDGRLCG